VRTQGQVDTRRRSDPPFNFRSTLPVVNIDDHFWQITIGRSPRPKGRVRGLWSWNRAGRPLTAIFGRRATALRKSSIAPTRPFERNPATARVPQIDPASLQPARWF